MRRFLLLSAAACGLLFMTSDADAGHSRRGFSLSINTGGYGYGNGFGYRGFDRGGFDRYPVSRPVSRRGCGYSPVGYRGGYHGGYFGGGHRPVYPVYPSYPRPYPHGHYSPYGF